MSVAGLRWETLEEEKTGQVTAEIEMCLGW